MSAPGQFSSGTNGGAASSANAPSYVGCSVTRTGARYARAERARRASGGASAIAIVSGAFVVLVETEKHGRPGYASRAMSRPSEGACRLRAGKRVASVRPMVVVLDVSRYSPISARITLGRFC